MHQHRTATFVAVSFLTFRVALAPMALEAQILGSEVQINATETGDQQGPSIGGGAAGGFVVVWSASDQGGSGDRIFGRRIDRSGAPRGEEILVSAGGVGDQSGAVVEVDGTGNSVVVWQRYDSINLRWQILGRRFDREGEPRGMEFEVGSREPTRRMSPSVAMRDSGEFVVAWQQPDGGADGIFARRFDAGGVALGNDFRVNASTERNQGSPEVGMDGSGNFVVVWASNTFGGRLDVFARRFDAAGRPIEGEFQVNTHTLEYQFGPAIAMSRSGSFVVAWHSSDGQDGSSYGVFGQRFDPSGSPAGPEFQVNSFTSGVQGNPDVAIGSNGEFIVAWDSEWQDGSQLGVFAQRYDGDGLPIGDEFRVNHSTLDDQYGPAAAFDGRGNAMLVWSSFGQDSPESFGVFGRRLRISLFKGDFESGDLCSWSLLSGGQSCS